MTWLVLDLETVVDRTLPPPKRKKDGAETFPPAPYHQIAVMGVAVINDYYQTRRICVIGEEGNKSERDTLAVLVSFLDQCPDTTVVSWNGRGFDMPVIAARCLRHGLAFPWYYRRRDVRYRYSTDGHFDLMDYVADHGAAKCWGLDVAAKAVGLPGKLDTKGADVEAMLAGGRLEEVRSYCLSDVAQTAALFLRVQHLRGEIDEGYCAEALRGLLVAMAAEPRLAPTLSLVDAGRLVPWGGVEGGGTPVPTLRSTSSKAERAAA